MLPMAASSPLRHDTFEDTLHAETQLGMGLRGSPARSQHEGDALVLTRLHTFGILDTAQEPWFLSNGAGQNLRHSVFLFLLA